MRMHETLQYQTKYDIEPRNDSLHSSWSCRAKAGRSVQNAAYQVDSVFQVRNKSKFMNPTNYRLDEIVV